MNKTKILLVAIVILAAALRLYKIDNVPPSISWDEAAVGYNAWTVAEYGKDEYGKTFPLTFKSFGDDKHPVHIYSTAIFVKLFGLSEFSIRIPAALFGVLNVLLMFYLGKILFKNEWIGTVAAIFLTISPYNIQFSRFNHETNFALFFFLLGLVTFFKALDGKKYLLPISFLSFGIDLFTYHSAKVVVPPILILLGILYFKKLYLMKKYFFSGIIILFLLLGLFVVNPALLGTARVLQTSFSKEETRNTNLYKNTQKEYLGFMEIVFKNYLTHFNPKYLFLTGGENPKFSTQVVGEFYKIDALFLIAGLVALIALRSKTALFLLAWAFLAPLPSSLTSEAPHAGRALFMMGSWHLISAYGFYSLMIFFKKRAIQYVFTLAAALILIISLTNYLKYYFGEYPQRYAIEWQYGMKQIVEFIKAHGEYNQVFTTDVRFQPYIFFLYYLKMPLPEYLSTVIYNNSQSKTYNNVVSFSKFYFGGGWNPIDSFPIEGTLYVVSPSQYDGLKYKPSFNVENVIYYPNGTSAFYLVSKK